MSYFKGVLAGVGTILLGCVVTPIAILLWTKKDPGSDGITIGFQPIGLLHSVGFWGFIIVLFSVGFFSSLLFQRK
jgi:hypothetical protein